MPREPLDPNSLRSERPDTYARTGDLTPAQKLTAAIKGMLVGDEYEYAAGILKGILKTIAETGVVTPGQQTAVSNIADRPRRSTPRDRRRAGW